ncbi:type IX secretion system membrane protein PorP/SprF [bacterium]|nr:type IX secretion system membrane protein PorP/SprF [bacterium]
MKKFLTINFLVIVLMFGALHAQVDETSAKALGMGGAYSAVALDGNAPVWNPAAMDAFKRMALALNYSAFHIGITDDFLQEGGLSYVIHLDRKFRYGSIGISYTQFLSDVYAQGELTLGYGKRIWGNPDGKCVSLGANFTLWRSWFNSGSFNEFDPADPLLLDGANSMTYSADAGIYIRPVEWLSFGTSVKNITQPDISISQDGSSQLPMKVRAGLGLDFDFIQPVVEVEYKMSAPSDKKLDIHIGVEKTFGENFALRAGWNRQETALGLGYMHWGEKFSWGLDYAALYPLGTELAKEYLTTHRITFNLFVEPPPVPVEDLAIVENSISIVSNRVVLGDEVTISAQIENRGEKFEKKVPVSIYYQDADGNWVLALPIEKIYIKPGETMSLKKKWIPPTKGDYTIYVAVDDYAKKLPAIKGKIEEVDEDNNVGFADMSVFRRPEGTIEPKQRTLSVSKLLLYQEEEPIIPIVFFGDKSTDVNHRFDRMLSIVANRLKVNSDVQIELQGYFDQKTDEVSAPDELAYQRAVSVRQRLISLGSPAEKVQIKREGYDPGESRAGLPEEQVIPRDRKMMHQENRRVELNAWFTEGKDFLTKISFDGTSTKPKNTEDISRFIPQMRKLMKANDEVIMLVEGYAAPGNNKEAALAFKRAANTAKWLKKQLGDEFEKRVYIHQAYESTVPTNEIYVFPNPEGVIYRPKEADRVLEDYTVDGSEENLVNVDAQIDAGVDSFAVSIVDERGIPIRVLAAGKGQIPNGIAWDWRDEAGMLLDFDEKYFAKLKVWDKMGEKLVSTSDTMAIKISKQGKRIESLVIVVFMFNEDVPQSKFLESRVEYVARRLIYRAEKGQYQLIATVTGHTDSIGPEYANLKLSQQRGERELENIKKYMIYLLGLGNDAELNKWLENHHVILKAKGYGEREPYAIRRWNSDTKQGEIAIIGNNELPEGRTVNRRVILEMKSEKLPDEK